jgi:hypothetical protein
MGFGYRLYPSYALNPKRSDQLSHLLCLDTDALKLLGQSIFSH